ncbi:MAG: GspE/PulE family protein, partial [Pseudoxanthomonas sp.]
WLELAGRGGDLAWQQAQSLGLPLIDMQQIVRSPDLRSRFPETAGRRLHATALLNAHGYLAIAVDSGADATMVSTLGFFTSQPIIVLVATTQARNGQGSLREDPDEEQHVVKQLGLKPGQRDEQRLAREHELSNRSLMIRTMRATMETAVQQRASDVHLRPGAKHYELLFRIDGNMVHQRNIIPEIASLVVNRLKVIAEMDLAEHRRAQDGRGTFRTDDGRSVDMRVSVIPTVLGESVVVRLLDTEESLKSIDEIQLTPADRAELDDQMNRSHGFFLTTGPTGCGKSTTLYAVLQELRSRPINILTVEDPVEYTLAGVRQMEVNQAIDVTFATSLRSFLRHDPDVIMVGEIRDRETARMAVESALTGHLVLSTLHTNTAATTVTRLLELGVEAYLLRAALTGIMAQRLVRLTCERCATREDPAPFLRAALGVGPDEQFTIGRGCPQCHNSGVFRRCAVYELMRITPAIRDLIAPGVDADRIHAAALAAGMIPITQAAVLMARQGRISLAEAYRVRAD